MKTTLKTFLTAALCMGGLLLAAPLASAQDSVSAIVPAGKQLTYTLGDESVVVDGEAVVAIPAGATNVVLPEGLKIEMYENTILKTIELLQAGTLATMPDPLTVLNLRNALATAGIANKMTSGKPLDKKKPSDAVISTAANTDANADLPVVPF